MLPESNDSHAPSLSADGARRHGQLSDWFGGRVRHGFGADLERFDPRFALDVVGWAGRLYGPGRYFDLSMRGLEQVPASPVMLVSNHSGGTTIPDVWGFGVAWYRHFGTLRPLHILAHELLFAVPSLARFFERVGVLRASQQTARAVLARGRDLLIFPGGDLETWRPYSRRYEVDFGGRIGFARLALEAGVPIVPVAHAGAHETLRVLTSGRSFARAVGLHRLARAEVWPIHLSLPWGLALGPLPHIPLPAKFRYLAGPAISAAPDTPASELAAQVHRAVQQQLHRLRDEALDPRA